jgi:hypothetical protein
MNDVPGVVIGFVWQARVISPEMVERSAKYIVGAPTFHILFSVM